MAGLDGPRGRGRGPRSSARTRPRTRSRRVRRPTNRRPAAPPRRTPPCPAPPSAAGWGRRSRCRSPPVARCRVSRRGWCRHDSAMMTLSTRSQAVAATMASRSAKPGLTPEPNIVEPPCLHASSIRSRSVAEVVPGDERRGRDDVHARRQDAHQLVDVDPHRVVDDAVGFQRQQRVHVVGGGDAERFDSDQLADVDPVLVLRPGVAPDEFVVRVLRDRLYRALSDISRRPLDDPIRGGVWHSLSIGKAARIHDGFRPQN